MSLVGVWRLIHTEAVDANGTRLTPPYGGDQAMGLISFQTVGAWPVCCATAVPLWQPTCCASTCLIAALMWWTAIG